MGLSLAASDGKPEGTRNEVVCVVSLAGGDQNSQGPGGREAQYIRRQPPGPFLCLTSTKAQNGRQNTIGAALPTQGEEPTSRFHQRIANTSEQATGQLEGESLSTVSQQEVDNGQGRSPAASGTIQKLTRRELFPDSKIFRALDTHVLRVSEQLKSIQQPLSVQTIVPLITKAARSQLEKVRAIWVWLCHNIKYDVDGFLGLSEKIHRPEHVLQTRRGVCSGYAHLCHEMCKEAGLTCVEVSGYGRGAGCHRGQTCLQKKSNHMWNAVKLEAQWFLLDACWGAGLVDAEKKLFIPRHEDFFFLTDPKHFVETHWPDEPAWQLLQPPISLADFEERVFKTPEFFKLQLSLLSPDTSVLKTEHGEATVSVEGALSTEFTYQLLKLCHDHSKEDVGKTYGMVTLSDKRMVLKVFPPIQGMFDLQIFARLSDSQMPCNWVCSQQIECLQANGREELPENPFVFWGLHPRAKELGIEGCNWEEAPTITTTGRLKLALQTNRPLLVTYELVHPGLGDPLSKKCLLSQAEEEKLTCHVLCPFMGYYRLSAFVKGLGEEEFKNVANFLIDCCSPVNQNELFPLGLSTHCGTGMSSQRRGLSSPSHTAPIINTKQGRCNITFHTRPGFEIMATLSKDHIRNQRYPMERYTFITHLEDKVSICILLPESGLYRVSLYGRSSNSSEFTHVCDYVIRCFTNPQWPPFPRVYSLWGRGCVLLRPRTGVLPAQSWERFRLKMPKVCSALVMGHAKTELRQGPKKVWEGEVYTGPAGTILKVAVKFSCEAPSMEVILSFDVEGSSAIAGDSSG
ncbi:kyphoscoliosis peptidase-like [Tiliqua scincoides]|uniref:kyphoscoliosis peptidase-like n=1 Tax=Tiliqua scincoides TaxID=71010 RepID=UPI0034622F88